MDILNKHAPLKQDYVKTNQAGFIYTELNHAIVFWSKFRNQRLKNNPLKTGQHINRQRKFCVKLLRCKKNEYFENLDLNLVSGNKIF